MRALCLCAAIAIGGPAALADEAQVFEVETITFKSVDGVPITADIVKPYSSDKPFILLFHQAGWSRGEYRAILPRLAYFGYNAMAIDQRSGKSVNKIDNATYAAARKRRLATHYVSALPDMRAAIAYAREHHAKGKLVLWGSSYSASLALRLAAETRPPVDGVLAFAPGEYFAKLGKSRTWIRQAAAKLTMPVFITSAKSERKKWQKIYDAIPSKKKSYFLPKGPGQHGSRALWTKFPDSPHYWAAVRAFLSSVTNR